MRETSESNEEGRSVGRRRFGAGLLTALGGGLLAGKAEAFPASAHGDFNAATRILNRYGMSVGGAFDDVLGHDVLKVTTIPQIDTQYDHELGQLSSAGEIDPCFRTSFFQEATAFT